jgi:hypothetical protein
VLVDPRRPVRVAEDALSAWEKSVIALWILGGLAVVGFGVYLGMPGDSTAAEKEIQNAIQKGKGGRRKTVRRRFTPLDLVLKRKKQSEVRQRSRERQPFKMTRSTRRR